MVSADPSDVTVDKILDSNTTGKRTRSGISFVYVDLEVAVGLVGKLHSNSGLSCSVTQLAAWMNQSALGGTFRATLAAAKSFGLLETNSPGQVSLTSLGQSAADETAQQNAIAEAFLKVPLHAVMYEQYEGNSLPPAAAIERQLETLGVPPKQKVRARQTFTKSAQFAGFINPETGRFIKPPAASASLEQVPKTTKGGGGGSDGEGIDLDPLLMALLRKIPPIDEGWSAGARARWFRTFAMNVSQIYDTADEVVDLMIKIEVSDTDSQTTRATE